MRKGCVEPAHIEPHYPAPNLGVVHNLIDAIGISFPPDDRFIDRMRLLLHRRHAKHECAPKFGAVKFPRYFCLGAGCLCRRTQCLELMPGRQCLAQLTIPRLRKPSSSKPSLKYLRMILPEDRTGVTQ